VKTRSEALWLVPVVGAVAVFGAVLVSTPPGFGAIRDVLFGLPRGANADAAAYALGAAASLALVALLLLTAACWCVRFVMRRS